MDIRVHVYALAVLIAVLAVLIIGSVSLSRAPLTVGKTVGSWGSGGVITPDTPAQQGGTVQQQASVQREQNSYLPDILLDRTQKETPGASRQTNASFDSSGFDALLSLVTSVQGTSSPKNAFDSVATLYAQLTAKTGIQSPTNKPRTPKQQELFAYGNSAGLFIKEFDDSHPDEVQVLVDFIADKKAAEKAAAVKKLANDLGGIGRSLKSLDHVPSGVQDAHDALAADYQDMGAKLSIVADARSDQELLSAIGTYNASADMFAKDFSILVLIFEAADVRFTDSDAGRVFTMNPAAF